jgi:hypothetical protein
MEQMLLDVISEGKRKPEHVKHVHVAAFEQYTRDFVQMLDECFAGQWPVDTPAKQDPFRRLYVHGWPFALKAIALAYHRARLPELGPMAAAIATDHDAGKTLDEAFHTVWEEEKKHPEKYVAPITVDELRNRLKAIDWLRYRKHWIDITGAKVGKKDGKKRLRALKDGQTVVDAQAQNTATVINAVAAKLTSDSWKDLTAAENAKP